MGFTSLGANTGDSGAVTLTANAVADTKGSYSEIIASTAEAYEAFILEVLSDGTAITDFAIDIATGAAASEVIFVADFMANGQRTINPGWYFFPIPIASGVRLSARCASSRTGGSAIEVNIIGLSSGPFGNIALTGTTGVDTMGFNSGDTGGVQVDPGGTANTKGSYSQIVASTSHAYDFLYIAFPMQDNIALTDADFLVDIATGGAGSEVVLLENIWISAQATNDSMTPGGIFVPLPSTIPAGTRIAARAQCSIIDAADRLFDVIIYGFFGDLPAVGGSSGQVHVVRSVSY